VAGSARGRRLLELRIDDRMLYGRSSKSSSLFRPARHLKHVKMHAHMQPLIKKKKNNTRIVTDMTVDPNPPV
jgi:hypothetical protein